ncbi:XdhC family protein [Nonomuraea africana]|uniref:Xanthine dehydrogenase accessory factor n=1 Tax=Nonomuraea africana TaxID=46171 RepID=A0ABR9KHP6_9ACTN|nr:XdhC family protein [Nonomuraea africana]MBE1561533.1 xanthine dehydrogenase accessory factor [Nonomuraea africana]
MFDLLEELAAWAAAGRRFAVASVVSTTGSAPRQAGAALAVSEDGEAIGSVSGGCVEGAVYELCLEVLSTGVPVRQTFGYSDDDAFAVGLTCGGIIEVLVWPGLRLLQSVRPGEPVALARRLGPAAGAVLVWPDRHEGTMGDAGLDAVVVAETRAMLEAGTTGLREICDVELFVESHAPPPRMLIFGAIDFAAALTKAGRLLGYHVTVCDARPVFATRRRFPDAHEVVVEWPHRYLSRTEVDSRTVVAVLTHDAKFDVPLLEVALRTNAGYVGAMGSRRTHEDRTRRLREAGLTEEELGRLRSPIGLDLGARTPEETAVSIVAEIIATRRGAGGRPLSETDGPIHRSLAIQRS